MRFTKVREQVIQFAKERGISSAVVAGRIRRERKDWSLFGDLVGQGSLRKLMLRQATGRTKCSKLSHFDIPILLAILKWKQGERAALTTYCNGPGRLHVLFDMPPAGDFDHEKHRPLTPTEHIKMFGRRLRDAWGNRVAFVDASCIDDELHREGSPDIP